MLKASAKEFLKHGYEGSTIERIAREAGGSLTTIYRQFGGKAGLFAAVVQENLSDLEAAIERVQLEGKGLAEGLTIFATIYVEYLLLPKTGAFFRAMIAESARFPELRAPVMDAADGVIKKLTLFFAEHATSFPDENFDPGEAAIMFASLVRGRFYVPNLGMGEPLRQGEMKAFVERAVHLILRAYVAVTDSADHGANG